MLTFIHSVALVAIAVLLSVVLGCAGLSGGPDRGRAPDKTVSPGSPNDRLFLGTYFLDNGQDGVYLAVSSDGLRFEPLLSPNVPIMKPKVGIETLTRDACILKGPDGVWHMAWTSDWWNRGFGVAHSPDLVNWSEQTFVKAMEHDTQAVNCWAPEIIYDDTRGEYLLLWSTTIKGMFPETGTTGDPGPKDVILNHRIYACTTKDFVSFSESKLYYDPGFNCIDATLIKLDRPGMPQGTKWGLFLKDETRHPPAKNIRFLALTDPQQPLREKLGPPSAPITGPYWAEGPTAFEIDGAVRVFFDRYADDRFGAVETTDLKTWKDISSKVSFPKGARHSTIFEVNRAFAENLRTKLIQRAALEDPSHREGPGEGPFLTWSPTMSTTIAGTPTEKKGSLPPQPLPLGGVPRNPRRPVSTYSIVARDAATGQFGVAVQSHWFSVGSVVPWAEAGVGAVATQSLVDVKYGPLGLALMKAGKTAPEALKALTSTDAGEAVRQVAMIDAAGNVATHTGSKCIAEAMHASGKAADGSVYSCQANLMRKNTVPAAMAMAFEASTGPLADRLVAALRAAESEGGDIRGKQSAAILIVRGASTGKPWEDRLVDLRVEDHPAPVDELARLVKLHRAYDKMNAGDLAIEKNDVAGALREYGAAREPAPGNAEMVFWTAVSLANAGKVDDALPLFKEAFKDTAGDWRETLRRLPKSGLLPDDSALLERLLNAGK